MWLVGGPVRSDSQIGKALSKAPAVALTVLVYHFPDDIFEVAPHKVDLYLAGHTHGGQVAFPSYGALMTSSVFAKQFEAVLYPVDETWLYVNRGIGMEGDRAARVRFCARSEVAVIDIVPPP